MLLMERLLQVSLVISLLGILLLTYISVSYEPQLYSIHNLNSENINQKVKINGQITGIKEYKDFSIIYIKEKKNLSNPNSTIQGLIDLNNKIKINHTQEYYFIGRISDYNKALQINIEKIILKK